MSNQSDYLKLSRNLIKKGYADYCTTSNFDEDYLKIYPQINKKTIYPLVSSYSFDYNNKLSRLIEKKYKLKNIILGLGSEDLIIHCCQIINSEKLRAGVVNPIFYRITDNLERYEGIAWNKFLLSDFQNYDVVWINNPNNLNGEILEAPQLLDVIKKNSGTLFIIDEAMMFMQLDWEKYSLLPYSKQLENLLIITSFSKLFGLSGLRLGFATGSIKWVDKIKKIAPTFPIPELTAYIAVKVIKNNRFYTKTLEKIYRNKKQIECFLKKNRSIEIKSSFGNCVYIRKKTGKDLYQELLKLGIISLNLNNYSGASRDYVRITCHSSLPRHKFLLDKLSKL